MLKTPPTFTPLMAPQDHADPLTLVFHGGRLLLREQRVCRERVHRRGRRLRGHRRVRIAVLVVTGIELLVLDATTGQNGLRQAKLFDEAVGVSGVALTKLDGTAKGGVAVAVAHELGLPVKLVGVGETLDDLQPFDPQDFARALVHGD